MKLPYNRSFLLDDAGPMNADIGKVQSVTHWQSVNSMSTGSQCVFIATYAISAK